MGGFFSDKQIKEMNQEPLGSFERDTAREIIVYRVALSQLAKNPFRIFYDSKIRNLLKYLKSTPFTFDDSKIR